MTAAPRSASSCPRSLPRAEPAGRVYNAHAGGCPPTRARRYLAVMSEENVEIVRRGFEAWNAGDMASVRKTYDPDAVMRYPPGFPEPGPFFGRDAIMGQFERLRDALSDRDSLHFVSDFLDAGDRVVIRFAWRGEGFGPAMNLEMSVIYTLRRGRIIEAEFFRGHDAALEAAGLSE
jgi:ketosteroid isomerase-like protein